MRFKQVENNSLTDIDAYANNLCSSLDENSLLMLMFWDNSTAYIGLNKCYNLIRNYLAMLKKRRGLAQILILKKSDKQDIYIPIKLIDIDFARSNNPVREYIVEHAENYYIDTRIKIIN